MTEPRVIVAPKNSNLGAKRVATQGRPLSPEFKRAIVLVKDYFDLGCPNRPMGLAHFLGLLIGVQNPASVGVLGQDDRVQKPGKEFGPKTAFLDSLTLVSAEAPTSMSSTHQSI